MGLRIGTTLPSCRMLGMVVLYEMYKLKIIACHGPNGYRLKMFLVPLGDSLRAFGRGRLGLLYF